MPHRKISTAAKRSDFGITSALIVAIIFFVTNGLLTYKNTQSLRRDADEVAYTHNIITALGDLLGEVINAETGQRGYLLTGELPYLQPYNEANARLQERLTYVSDLTRPNPNQQRRLSLVRTHLNAKLAEMDRTIELRRTQGFNAAIELVRTNHGKAEMDSLRAAIQEMQDDERASRQKRIAEMQEAYISALGSILLSSSIGLVLAIVVAYLMRTSARKQRQHDWLRSGQVGLGEATAGDQQINGLSEQALTYLAQYTGAQAGALFVRQGDFFVRAATYGVPEGGNVIERFRVGDGLLGQAVKDKRSFLIDDIPDGYLTIGSALGRDKPRHLAIMPAVEDDYVNAVLELGYLHPVDATMRELLDLLAPALAVAVQAAHYRSNLQELLEETQRQAEELQAQSEELRVNNEELEEQSRALRESQTRLEQQQAELEQTNAQLEEQAQILETQRDDLERTKVLIQTKADELEQASRYKSDFLANMSHELRTPLNSSLILAKLLADNPRGNLSDEQVKFAQTILSSGNDLLTLINDILDLSKIEAGHMEVQVETVSIKRIADDMKQVFEPLSAQKGLDFRIKVARGCTKSIETDVQRLEQVLKNLLSNAIKFTDAGSVEVHISQTEEHVRFAVRDSGIGIPKEQQQSIFEAFRQADGTISRRYGGTGLGLSISRELVHLLAGSLELESQEGEGSTFTVVVPLVYDPALVEAKGVSIIDVPNPEAERQPQKEKAAQKLSRLRRVEDDREHLTGDKRVILVVEDDPSFARVLYDIAHEMDFQCLIAQSAEEALIAARQYLPKAVVLDIGLPDNSGLSVLDRLKHDARTRHIPVHVVSASDYAQTALSLGAVGYLLKPIKREELMDALASLENRFAQRMRQVLIVEDDPVQLDSICKLLGTHDVKTVGARTVAECLEHLRTETFDCMVLDLSLPDASGYALLETLSQEDAYAFPPVIVYTGRDLSQDEEHQLRKYSKSIIIKGAKSPERLLDEVTLFLHQVVADLPPEQQEMLEKARNRDAALENRRILVVEDDVRNVYALTSILEPHGVFVQIARNGKEALKALEKSMDDPQKAIDLVLMDVMMPEMDGLTATREIRKRKEWRKLPIITLTAKAMKDDQERCLEAGANDYMAKPLDVEKLLSLVRVWMPR